MGLFLVATGTLGDSASPGVGVEALAGVEDTEASDISPVSAESGVHLTSCTLSISSLLLVIPEIF